jgi:hypothetical protein
MLAPASLEVPQAFVGPLGQAFLSFLMFFRRKLGWPGILLVGLLRPRPEPPQRANRHAWRTRPELPQRANRHAWRTRPGPPQRADCQKVAQKGAKVAQRGCQPGAKWHRKCANGAKVAPAGVPDWGKVAPKVMRREQKWPKWGASLGQSGTEVVQMEQKWSPGGSPGGRKVVARGVRQVVAKWSPTDHVFFAPNPCKSVRGAAPDARAPSKIRVSPSDSGLQELSQMRARLAVPDARAPGKSANARAPRKSGEELPRMPRFPHLGGACVEKSTLLCDLRGDRVRHFEKRPVKAPFPRSRFPSSISFCLFVSSF